MQLTGDAHQPERVDAQLGEGRVEVETCRATLATHTALVTHTALATYTALAAHTALAAYAGGEKLQDLAARHAQADGPTLALHDLQPGLGLALALGLGLGLGL